MSKKILIIQRSAPYGSSLAREGIDYVLTSAAYDQDISLLFLGDGIFQLLANQNSKDISLKNQLSALEVLPLYDVENLYATHEDLNDRSITADQLGLKVNLINREDVHQLIDQQDHVMGF